MNTSTPQNQANVAPDSTSMSALAGSFISIRSANMAIKMQASLQLPEHDNGNTDSIENLRGVNDALLQAREHATLWETDISAQVQDQLQRIVSHSDFYGEMAEPLNEAIEGIKNIVWGSADMRDALNNIHDYAGAIADNINEYLYGSGKTIADYEQGKDYRKDTIYGNFMHLREYQDFVAADKRTFSDYINKLTSDDTGIDEDIKNLNSSIEAYRKAISNDEVMIAGGSAAVATGAVLVVIGVALIPESAGASMAIGAVGVAGIVGGIAADSYGVYDLMQKQDKIVSAKRHLQELNADKAAIIGIKDTSHSMEEHTASIYNSLGNIITNWQQMQNSITDTMKDIKGIDDAGGGLQKYINEAKTENPKSENVKVIYAVLHSKLAAPASEWQTAAEKAKALLNAIAQAKTVVLEPNTPINQETFNRCA